MRSPTLTLALAATAVISVIGCASVTVNKVPTPAQYVINGKSEWTREMQKAADSMEGFRFYLPRPFINVFESFPIATDIYLASGRVSPDGRFIAIDSVMPVSTANDFDRISSRKVRTLPADMKIPQNWIFRPGAAARNDDDGTAPRGGARSGLELSDASLSPESLTKIQEAIEETRENAAEAAKQSTESKDAADQASKAASDAKQSAQQTTGQNRRNVTNDNGAFAYQPLRGNFDLLYLPDFDEQYVVSSQSGLGNAEFQMNLGQGWSLQGFNSFTDNSALTKRVFDVIDTGLELGKAAARAAALSAGVPLPGAARTGIEPPAPGQVLNEAAGTPVALKIVVVHYAAKGLYPVIKPRELIAARPSAFVLDLAVPAGGLPQLAGWINARAALNIQEEIEKRSTVPVYPYQYVSFNTFRYMAIEALTPQGSPFGTLYDKTGTTGEAGDRRQEDPTPPPPKDKPDTAALTAAVKALEAGAGKAANDTIAEAMKATPPAQHPKVTSVSLLLSKADAGSVVSGTIKWTGAADAMPDSLQIKIKEAIGKVIIDSKDLTTMNGGKALTLSPSIGFARNSGGPTTTPVTPGATLAEALTKLQPKALSAAIAAASASQPTPAPMTPVTVDAVLLRLATQDTVPIGRVWVARIISSGSLGDEQKVKVREAIEKVVGEDLDLKKLNGNAVLPSGATSFMS